jgi:hypothetical protein
MSDFLPIGAYFFPLGSYNKILVIIGMYFLKVLAGISTGIHENLLVKFPL